MAFREILGLVLIAVALVLTPVAWTFSRMLWFVAFAMFVVGVALFFTDRIYRRISKAEAGGSGGSGSSGHAMPTDTSTTTQAGAPVAAPKRWTTHRAQGTAAMHKTCAGFFNKPAAVSMALQR
jgi:hypothetical protein